ncbi:hypothetical protein HK405_004377 [Cladochytrium tenue]|nr:hypothetical protein HK405_004377 [Cladochytrium tenue]
MTLTSPTDTAATAPSGLHRRAVPRRVDEAAHAAAVVARRARARVDAAAQAAAAVAVAGGIDAAALAIAAATVAFAVTWLAPAALLWPSAPPPQLVPDAQTLAVLSATYLVSTVASAVLIVIALVPFPSRRLRILHTYRHALMLTGTIVTEAPQLFLVVKFVALLWFSSKGVFLKPHAPSDDPDGTTHINWARWIYFFDVGVFLAYWALLLQLYYAKRAVENPTSVFKSAESTEPPSLWT